MQHTHPIPVEFGYRDNLVVIKGHRGTIELAPEQAKVLLEIVLSIGDDLNAAIAIASGLNPRTGRPL